MTGSMLSTEARLARLRGSQVPETYTARKIAALNSLASDNATVATDIVASPRGNGNLAVHVTVTTNLTMYLARVLTSNTSLSVVAIASAEIQPGVANGGRSAALLVQ